jgi:hypothetical protein
MSDASATAAPESIVLRVERVHDGQTMIVRTLSDTYGGLLTHGSFVKGKWQSTYCDPGSCCVGRVRDKRFWYGYAACQWWKEDCRKWFPIVLEITEALELDLRDVYKRGQIWELFRPAKQKNKQLPTTGRLVRQDEPETLPAGFDVRAALYSVYHVFNIPLDVPNPHPKRVLLEPVADEPPQLPKVTLEDLERRRRQEEYYRTRQEEAKRRA